MCHWTCIEFVEEGLAPGEVESRSVLEVGARDVNGSVRGSVKRLGPRTYLGVDIEQGPGVDEICDVQDLRRRFGDESFDVVISTELVEHVRDWRGAFENLKSVLRPGGVLLVTTRSPGFKVHGYPWDYWRYEPSDMERILADFDIASIEGDRVAPGVFVKAVKPADWHPADLSGIPLYSIATKRRVVNLSPARERAFRVLHRGHLAYRRILPERVRAAVRSAVGR